MTPTEIAALSDHELKWEIARKLGWINLWRFVQPDGKDAIRGRPPIAPQDGGVVVVPDWPRDPAASAELRRELWITAAALSIGWSLMSISVSLDSMRNGVRREYDACVPLSMGADPILTECRAVAEAALQLLQKENK